MFAIIDVLLTVDMFQANGFYGSSGPSGRLPEGYTLMEQRFMRAVRDARREWIPPELGGNVRHPGVQLREWEKDGWTYHAKGALAAQALFTLAYYLRTCL